MILTPPHGQSCHCHCRRSLGSQQASNRDQSACSAGALSRADAGTRTPDPFITSEVLCQLSYVGAASGV